jgi:alpha-ketoglutarate-dependent taurine dioxygenase
MMIDESISELISPDPATTQRLLTPSVDPAIPFSEWTNPPSPCDPAIDGLRARIAAALDDAGFVVVRLARAAEAGPHATAVAAWNLFRHLAEPLPHSAAGELVYEVTVREAPPPHRYYSQSNIGGDIHTDGTYIHAEPPLYAALACLQPAHAGGDSVLVDGRRVCAALEAHARPALEWLEREYHFDCDGQGLAATLRRRILEKVNGSVRVQYLRSYVESGHRRAGELLASEALDAMDALDELLAHPPLRHVVRLEAGDMLLLNNHVMLHGRTAFVDDPDHALRRRLIRLWGRPRA